VGGGSYDRRTAIHSAKEVKMRRVGSRGMDIILVGRKSVKNGMFQFIKAQKKWGRKEKAKGDKGQGCMMGGRRGRGQEEALQVTKSGLLIEVTYSHYGCF